MENKNVKCIITILLGWLGVHKFMEKKNAIGVLYLFTMGLFGIGWIIDSINSIKELKNNPSNTSQEKENSKSIISEKNINNLIDEKIKNEENQVRKNKLNELKSRMVKVIDINNEEKEIKQYKNFIEEDSDIVLISKSDGDNKIYHLWYDCYESWSEEYKSKFEGWKEENYNKIKDEYSICRRCQESSYRYNNPNSTITGYSFKYYYDEYDDIDDIDYSYLLTKHEYNQLEVFNRLNDFSKIYKELKSKNKYFKKNDVLWSIYNDARLEYEHKKDTAMLSVVFDRQSDILISDRKYDQALQMFSASLYLILYEYEYSTKEVNLFDTHLNNRRKDKLKKLLSKTKIPLTTFEKEFDIYVQDNIPSLYDDNKTKIIIKNIIERIK